MNEETRSLGEALPVELKRCRELVGLYRELGDVGEFGARMIELDIEAAEKAIMAGDVVEMIRCYEVLKGNRE